MRYAGIMIVFICTSYNFNTPDWKAVHIHGFAQGTTYSITYYAADSVVTKKQIDSIFKKLDSSLSLYKPYSLINQFNQSSKGITTDEHLTKVLKKSIETYKNTKGLFDITIYPLVQAWGFGPARTDSIPDETAVKQLKKCTGTNHLKVRGNHLYKKKPCIAIDMNGIAQGYSVDVIADFLESYGIKNYLAELGGEIRIKGRKQPSGEKMKIGIESPDEDEFGNHLLQKIIRLEEGAITTSGSYRKYYESAGKKIIHLIDPTTGYPVQNELISVSVFAKDAITADAYDNALMLMGLEKAISFTEKRKDIAAYFIYKKNDGNIADTASTRFYKLLNQ